MKKSYYIDLELYVSEPDYFCILFNQDLSTFKQLRSRYILIFI